MCGFAGSVGSYDSQHFWDSLKLIDHRGPDNQSVLELSALILGHTRLSIRDLSARSNQPMRSERGNALVYNGEIYNCDELYDALSSASVIVDKGSDTKLLLACLEHFGVEVTLSRINGMFAFSYYDSLSDKIYLCRDHLGIKPLYYSFGKDSVLHFASTVECVDALSHSSVNSMPMRGLTSRQNINTDAIASYLCNGFSSANNVWLHNISELPPGHFISFDLKNLELTNNKWFDLPSEYHAVYEKTFNKYLQAKPARVVESKLSELNCTLEKVVSEHCLSDVGCGLFLSGGLDSSLLASYVPEQANLKAFTIRYHNDPYGDEVAIASRVADKFGIELIVSDYDLFGYDLDACVQRILQITKFPFYNITVLAQDFLCGLASSANCKVVLAGDGADELFGGYPRYQAALYREILRTACLDNRLLLRLIDKFTNKFSAYLGRKKSSHFGRRLASFTASLVRPPSDVHSHYLNNIPPEFIAGSNLDESYSSFVNSEIFSSMPLHCSSLIADMISFLPWNLLKSSDQASMHNGIEMRVPFCDRRLLSLSAAMCKDSISLKSTKIPLRSLAKSRGLSFLASHSKRGFSPPLRLLIDSNRDSVYQCFADTSFFSQFIDVAYLSRLRNSHYVDGLDCSKQIFSLYMLKYWWDHCVQSDSEYSLVHS